MDREFRSAPTAPVSVGEELDVRVEAVGEKGDGIVKKNGFVIFVPGVKEGEEIRIRVTKVLAKVGFAEKVGATQGPIGGGNRPPRRQAPSDADIKQVLKSEPLEEAYSANDSDDFGSDLPEEE